MGEPLAHSANEEGKDHHLADHLVSVADLAAGFADAFDSGDWGRLAGLWHDLGKYQEKFQERLGGESIRVEHSGIGAALAAARDGDAGMALSFVLAGHHAGLPNLQKSEPGLPKPLTERLQSNLTALGHTRGDIPSRLLDAELPSLPRFLETPAKTSRPARNVLARTLEFWIRFVFSCLVDADWLDTEAFMRPDVAAERRPFSSPTALAGRLDAYIAELVENLTPAVRSSAVNLARAEVLSACREAAEDPPGVFALTVPTGGAKTLSAMSFALRHAWRHDLRRVIVVIPYTSIIEQNADQYREALGAENVVEHHCNLDPDRATTEQERQLVRRHELAAENWDAPVIVTTSVQFFESLFANRPARCRKLHNIARSVVILDEVQTVPPRYLLSVVEALGELVSHYGCSVVLSTATPPALRRRPGFDLGLRGVREIVPEPERLSAELERVRYEWPANEQSAVTWEDLCADLAGHTQVLAVVHRRADARTLAEMLVDAASPDAVYHLSALMCAAHRSDVLEQIRHRLARGRACRVVSTQLVEAGVDLDFPMVYRAMAGLDSIVQAAGRCNREGTQDTGRVVVFRAPTSPPPGTPRKGMDTTESLLREAGGALDPGDPALFEKYFRILYSKEHIDARGVQADRQQLNFATVAANFKLIEDGFTTTVAVPYEAGEKRLQNLRSEGPDRERLRALQRYLVSIYPRAFEELASAGALEEVIEGIFALAPGYSHLYDPRYGLTLEPVCGANPRELIA